MSAEEGRALGLGRHLRHRPTEPESTNQRRSNCLMDVPGGPRIGQSDLDTMLAAIAA